MSAQSILGNFRFTHRSRAIVLLGLAILCAGTVAAAASPAARAATVSGAGVYNEGTITATFDVEGDALTASGTAEFVFDGSVVGSSSRQVYRGEATCVEATVTKLGSQATIGGDLTLFEDEHGPHSHPLYFHVTVVDNVRGDEIDQTSSWWLNDTPGCVREGPSFKLASGGFTITGAVGPETVISNGPSGPTKDSTPTFAFASSEAKSTFQCRFDAEEFAPCSGPGAKHTPPAPLADGPHSFEAIATDAAGYTDQTPASVSFSVDTQAPDTILISGPTGSIPYTQPTFAFSSDDPTAQFECILDKVVYGCESPFQTGSLAEGKHTLRLRARDEAGNLDKSPVSLSFTIDLTAPETTVTAAPTATKDSTPTIRFASSEAGSTFKCRIDGEAFTPCSGPGAVHTPSAPLADGEHELDVVATDKAGNADASPASAAFTVDTVKPETTIDGGPDGSSGISPSFYFSSDDPTSHFECRLGSAPFSPCSSPNTYFFLAFGPYVFQVRAVDAAGNVDPTPAKRKFVVDHAETSEYL